MSNIFFYLFFIVLQHCTCFKKSMRVYADEKSINKVFKYSITISDQSEKSCCHTGVGQFSFIENFQQK